MPVWTAGKITVVAALLMLGLTPYAHAEGSFFDFLFGGQSPEPAQPRQAPPQAPRERMRPRPQPTRAAAPRRVAPASAQAPAQKPDVVVAVFGDGFAVSVARGLTDTESTDGVRQILDRSDAAASLTATDAAAWDKAIEAAKAPSGGIDAAVLLLGSNDGGPLVDPQNQKQAPGSPAWRQLYGDRIARLADQFRDKHVPLIWVGLPIVRDPDRSRLYAAINEVVQERATREGARFVDSWQPFADENGDFSTTGPDVDGRPATLRWSNGWNFTRAGAKKLASFVLPDLRQLRDRAKSTKDLAAVPTQAPDAFDQALAIDVNAQIFREAGLPVPNIATVPSAPGPILALTAAPLAIDGHLASIQVAPSPAFPSRATTPAGRADDFSWPRH